MRLPDPVPEEVREERRARFMAVQERISAARLARKVGTTLDVIVDEVAGTRAVARSQADAPEIDGVVHLTGARDVRVGDVVRASITGSDAHDLTGKLAR